MVQKQGNANLVLMMMLCSCCVGRPTSGCWLLRGETTRRFEDVDGSLKKSSTLKKMVQITTLYGYNRGMYSR
jgi:hypothetical protein